MYRPPRQLTAEYEIFFDTLETIFMSPEPSYACGKNIKIILTGDLNVCLSTASNNLNRLEELMDSYKLVFTTREITRVSAERSSALDTCMSMELTSTSYTT